MERDRAEITEITRVGENDHGYWFGVGLMGGRWVGFAMGQLKDGSQTIFFLPGISENYYLGLTDREMAIKKVGAVAQDPTHGYGGIERWFVDESLRGRPEDFSCALCGETGCEGQCIHDEGDFWE